jgi:phosphatidylglycerophosphate synthase
MIGAIIYGDFADRTVLGLSVLLRSVLSLQAVGVSEVVLIGAASDFTISDPRVQLAVRSAPAWPADDTLVVADGVVLNPAVLRTMIGQSGEVRVHQGTELLIARTQLAGASLAELQSTAGTHECLHKGVALLARTETEVRHAESALLASLQKPQDGWVSRTINRKISLACTRYLARTSLTPNQISAAILLLGVSSGLVAQHGRWGLLVAGLMFQAQSVLDGCDGELSRVTFRGSKAGEWLDTVGDDLTNYSFFAGASLSLRAMGFSPAFWMLGLLGVAVGFVASGIEYRYLLSIGSGDLLKYPLGFGEDPDKPVDPSVVQTVLGAIRPAFKRDFFAFATMIAAIVGPEAVSGALVVFALGAIATLGAVLSSEWRRRGAVPHSASR